MKKIFVRILVIFVVVIVAVVVACFVMLNTIVKKSVETMGPKVAKVEIKLGGVNLSPFSGKGEISALVVGNPEGFKAPNAITIGTAIGLFWILKPRKDTSET